MRMVFPHSTGRLINDLATDMNTLVESFFNEECSDQSVRFAPRMDIEETDTGYEFALDLPGVKPEDVNVDIEDNRLTIHGVRRDTKEDTEGGKRRVERVFGEFRRAVELPKTVDRDGIVANYEHGVLTILLPKAAKAGSRRIEINQAKPAEEA